MFLLQIPTLNPHCQAVFYISKPRGNCSPSPAGTACGSAGKLKDANVWTKQTLSSPQTGSKWPLHKQALQKTPSFYSMDSFQPMAYLCLLGCFMGEKAAWRRGTSSAKPSMKVQQQVNKSFPSCQGPNWGKGKWKLTKYMCFHQLCLSSQEKNPKVYETKRWHTDGRLMVGMLLHMHLAFRCCTHTVVQTDCWC